MAVIDLDQCFVPDLGKPTLSHAWGETVPYSVEGYEQRAQECARLANQTADQMVGAELLKLRQTYLKIAEQLRKQGFESPPRSS